MIVPPASHRSPTPDRRSCPYGRNLCTGGKADQRVKPRPATRNTLSTASGLALPTITIRNSWPVYVARRYPTVDHSLIRDFAPIAAATMHYERPSGPHNVERRIFHTRTRTHVDNSICSRRVGQRREQQSKQQNTSKRDCPRHVSNMAPRKPVSFAFICGAQLAPCSNGAETMTQNLKRHMQGLVPCSLPSCSSLQPLLCRSHLACAMRRLGVGDHPAIGL